MAISVFFTLCAALQDFKPEILTLNTLWASKQLNGVAIRGSAPCWNFDRMHVQSTSALASLLRVGSFVHLFLYRVLWHRSNVGAHKAKFVFWVFTEDKVEEKREVI